MGATVTVSLIKADVGGWPGHASVHPALEKIADIDLFDAKKKGSITDYFVTHAGDDLQLLISHTKGENNDEIHRIAWTIFTKATSKAKELNLYAAGQDILKNTFSGNIKGMGPGIAEMEFTERPGETLIAFMMDKTEPGAFNLPLYKAFADPFTTAGLVIDPAIHDGFNFEIWDIRDRKRVFMNAPEEMYDLLALIGAKERYVIKKIFPRGDPLPKKEPAAVICTEKLYNVAGRYIGKDDPVALVRAQNGLPALGEVLESWAFPHLVSGWMRGSHNGPVMPVSIKTPGVPVSTARQGFWPWGFKSAGEL